MATTFNDLLEEYIGDADSLDDIQVVVRRLWFYDFDGYPVRMWQGQGTLITEDGLEWMGTIDANKKDHHKTPSIQDARDGSSGNYQLSMTIIDTGGESARELYESLKADQWRVANRKVTCYLVVFKHGEALRPTVPYVFFKELRMMRPKFTERPESNGRGGIKLIYQVSISGRDENFGRARRPNRSYADTMQKQHAKELGVAIDRGCEYLATLANKTMQIP